ncbi:MAG: aminotransferase class III-fold pyridoxal phosphate-dependent enzyme [Candidatus Latescibacteria bacterium]|nr:aminotransferase class III-fold pyridoxal phosphate-dependent enzyme [Candidatus Latescibacterota bacterium]
MSTANALIDTYRQDRPQSVDLLQRARAALGGTVGHDLRHFNPVPLYIKRGDKGRKWDVDGHEYIDFLLGNGALLLGHAHPAIVEAIGAVLADGTHFGSDHPLHIEWAERVQALVPTAQRVRFVNSGTEATLLALRLARAFSGRSQVLRFDGHFHGWHDDVVTGFQPPFEAAGSLGAAHPKDRMVAIADGDLNQIEDAFKQNPDLGAAIIEPSGASWGRVPLAADFLQGLRDITARHQAVLIFDEVVTGFRFAPGGAQQLYKIDPDLSCFAKILTGGMPGGAVTGRADIMDLMNMSGDPQRDRFQRVTHLGTFNAAPPCAAAGIALLDLVGTGQPTAQADALATQLRAAWDKVLEQYGIAGYVYGASSTFHVYFETDPDRVQKASSRSDLHTLEAGRLKGMPGALIDAYQRHLRHRGVDIMSSTGGVLSSVHTEIDIAEATQAFEQTVVALRDEDLVITLG